MSETLALRARSDGLQPFRARSSRINSMSYRGDVFAMCKQTIRSYVCTCQSLSLTVYAETKQAALPSLRMTDRSKQFPEAKSLASLLIRAREKRGWSLRGAVQRAGDKQLREVTLNTLGELERAGTKHPDPEVLRAVAKLYSVDYADLIEPFLRSRYGVTIAPAPPASAAPAPSGPGPSPGGEHTITNDSSLTKGTLDRASPQTDLNPEGHTNPYEFISYCVDCADHLVQLGTDLKRMAGEIISRQTPDLGDGATELPAGRHLRRGQHVDASRKPRKRRA